MTKCALIFALATALAVPAFANEQAPAYIVDKFKAMYPKTTFNEVRKSKVAGLYEVVMGENIAYTDESGRFFIFGHLFDMQEQMDLTAQRQREAKRSEFPTQHLANAIKTVKGDGSRVFAVFSDPDCPYCKQLEGELARLDNVTVYTFLYPLESLHPQAKTKAVSVWCAPNHGKAWSELMLASKKPKLVACNNPVNVNLVLGSKLGVVGTPTLIAADGRVMSGFVPAEKLDQWLNDGKPVAQQGAAQ